MSSPSFVARLALMALLMSTVAAAAQTGSAAASSPPATAGSSSQSSTTNSTSAPAPEGFFPEPGLLSAAVDFVMDKAGDGTTRESGFYPEFSNMITGAGWVSIGPGYRRYLRDDHVMFDTSAALSWRLYKMGQARVEFLDLAHERLTLGIQGMWQDQTQVNFFGIGPDDVEDDDQTQYRMQSFDVVGYGTYRATDWLAFDGTLGWLPSLKVMPAGGTFQPDFPDTQAAFPTVPAASVSDQPSFLHGMLAVRADTRDHPGHPTRGWYYRAALTNYTEGTIEHFSFNQWEAEGTQFVPLADRRWVLGFRGWIVSAKPLSGNEVPFYFLPSIGGHTTLRDFHTLQFHDNAAVVVNAESRWSIFTHMDGAIFFDAGNVAPTVDELNLDKVSYGAGVRVHIERTTIARFDVAGGPQGWRVVFRTNDPLRLSRYKRRIAIPFTP